MEYHFRNIEKKWQEYWRRNQIYKVSEDTSRPKFYVLDMFPYPSGAGLHVGHPLGYIASDIYSRYKRLKGFNVLHPMGYDAFGLPAEQYAIQTGQHPAITTEKNIARYREQLDNLGFSFDWSREVRTCEPSYYKWTQWIFIQLFNSWYNLETDQAEPVSELISRFENSGNEGLQAVCSYEKQFSAELWNSYTHEKQQDILLNYRLAYLSDTMVNWCPALGTVLANEEVKDGRSERGGHPVIRKQMKQWSLRITAYADRLLEGLEKIDWPESIKEAQRNWIGRSEGTSLKFELAEKEGKFIEVFTTRPDTVFGVTFVTLAPEHEMVERLVTREQASAVRNYIDQATNKTERERMAEVKNITGVFTGSYVRHPFTSEEIPVWVGDYVLAGYGTGAVMGVPGHDSRDFAFARHFGLPIKEVVKGGNIEEEAYEEKSGEMINSSFLNGLQVKDAITAAIKKIEEKGIGRGKVNFRLRDAIFSRQRYWGEPFPVYYKEGMPYVLDPKDLPVKLPDVDAYLPTENGEPPLARAKNWNTSGGYPLETGTMPGWAGSSWYFLRYMDPQNQEEMVSAEAADYWKNVDLYIGGAEHATGHLLYVRFWTKFLFDLGLIPCDEPAQKLINQGMIQGRSNFVYRIDGMNVFVSFGIIKRIESLNDEQKKSVLLEEIMKQLGSGPAEKFKNIPLSISPLHVDVNFCENDVLDQEKFRSWRAEFSDAQFLLEKYQYVCGAEVEKMSKSKWNVVNPDDLIEKYGADTLRIYEMFLGPLEMSKPWNTNGITGVYGFLRKFWKLFHPKGGEFQLSEENPSDKELKVLHKTLKKLQDDYERFSFNTSVSGFMICVNELTDLKCNKRKILEPLLIALSPFAPHFCEELWNLCGHSDSIVLATFPEAEEKYLQESEFDYPVSINGKTRAKLTLSLGMSREDVEKEVLRNAEILKWLEGNSPKKVIVVPGRIVNIVV